MKIIFTASEYEIGLRVKVKSEARQVTFYRNIWFKD